MFELAFNPIKKDTIPITLHLHSPKKTSPNHNHHHHPHHHDNSSTSTTLLTTHSLVILVNRCQPLPNLTGSNLYPNLTGSNGFRASKRLRVIPRNNDNPYVPWLGPWPGGSYRWNERWLLVDPYPDPPAPYPIESHRGKETGIQR